MGNLRQRSTPNLRFSVAAHGPCDLPSVNDTERRPILRATDRSLRRIGSCSSAPRLARASRPLCGVTGRRTECLQAAAAAPRASKASVARALLRRIAVFPCRRWHVFRRSGRDATLARRADRRPAVRRDRFCKYGYPEQLARDLRLRAARQPVCGRACLKALPLGSRWRSGVRAAEAVVSVRSVRAARSEMLNPAAHLRRPCMSCFKSPVNKRDRQRAPRLLAAAPLPCSVDTPGISVRPTLTMLRGPLEAASPPVASSGRASGWTFGVNHHMPSVQSAGRGRRASPVTRPRQQGSGAHGLGGARPWHWILLWVPRRLRRRRCSRPGADGVAVPA